MPIYQGNKEIESVFFGTTPIQQIYQGTNEIWSNGKVIDLGWGTSWNIKNLYPNLYSQLTADNFFFLSANSSTGGASVSVAYVGDTKYLTIRAGIIKSYDSSSGILTFYDHTNNGVGSMHCVMVVDTSKLTYLGLGTSFNIASRFPNDYMNFTSNNFLIRTIRHWNSDYGGSEMLVCNSSRSSPGNYSATSTWSFIKSYNASTGVLTAYSKDRGSEDTGDTWDRNSSCYAYFTKKLPK